MKEVGYVYDFGTTFITGSNPIGRLLQIYIII